MPRRRLSGPAAGTSGARRWNIDLRKVLIAALAVTAATVAVRSSVAGIFGGPYPQRAIGWAPLHTGLNARLAELLVNAGRTNDARPLAYAALRRDPTNIAALRALALAAEAEGNGAEAARLFGLAHDMSRRDRQTEAWLLRHAIRTGDFAAAIRHFDISMRITARGGEQFIPLLVAATGDRRIMIPLRRQLEQQPSWKVAFLVRLATHGPRPDHTVILSRGLLDPADPRERDALRTLIESLTNARQTNLAWLIFRETRPGIRNPQAAPYVEQRFEPSTFPPFDWRLAEEPDLSAQADARPDGAAGRALFVMARSGASGEAARRLIRLAPGAYAIEYDAGGMSSNAFERPQLTLRCVGADASLVDLRPNWAGVAPRRARASFTVPQNCEWQSLAISISAGEEEAANRPWIANLSIRRAE